MNNKIKFLRGTSGEYTVAEKDNDTIYFTTDDGKLYIGNKEVSGGGSGGMTVDTLLDITITRNYIKDTQDFSNCSPAQNSIITLSGNTDDYKFIYITNTYNGKYNINDYSSTAAVHCLPRIFDASVFTWDCLSNNIIAALYGSTHVKLISANEVQIVYNPNSITTDNLTERVIVLGIK